jgi:hypothetical protein
MKLIFNLTIFVFLLAWSKPNSFFKEASELAKNLKQSLASELKMKIAKDGAVEAISFCHENAGPLAKKTVGVKIQKYEFGRTSHLVRNPANTPKEWMKKYLDQYKNSTSDSKLPKSIVHLLPEGKKVYLEPIYIQAECLMCHGSSVSKVVLQKIKQLYPNDQATGFKLGEFRGFVWVKQK